MSAKSKPINLITITLILQHLSHRLLQVKLVQVHLSQANYNRPPHLITDSMGITHSRIHHSSVTIADHDNRIKIEYRILVFLSETKL